MTRILFLFLLFSVLTYSQELNCKVTVNYEGLSSSNRDLLKDFANDIESYINTTSFTDNWPYDKINCSFQIFFLSAASDVNYTAQVVISAQRPIYKTINNSLLLSLNDNTWNLSYQRGQNFYANQSTFDPLTSFIDYYANIIIGFYMESWQELGGSPFFSKASDIVTLGANSRFSTGWEKNSNTYSRRGLVDDLLNDKYRAFRVAYYDYYYGIDLLSTKPDEGKKYILNLITVLDDMRKKFDINSVLIKVFFDAKVGEIIEILKDYPDKEIFKKLKKIDPGHTSKYDAFI